MKYRKFGKLDWEASILGFGLMRLPLLGKELANVDEDESIRMIRYAIDHGVNYLDTAYVYNMGGSERVLGKALKDGYREKVKLATKMPSMIVQKTEDFERIFSEQLERLQLDRIDFYLMHGLNKNTWTKMRDLGVLKWAEGRMAGGNIDYLGFSFHDNYEAFQEIVDAYDNWTLAQVQYNYMDVDFQAGRRGVEYAAGKGLAVVVMEPLRGGLLNREPPEIIAGMLESSPRKLKPVEWAFKWIWNQPEIAVALSGMSTMQQLTENLAIADGSEAGELTAGELELIDKVRETYIGLRPIKCSGCKYCMPCPNGVDIPMVFELYEDAVMYDGFDVGQFRYNHHFGISEDQLADKCTECLECLEKCPQHIQIPDWLKKSHEALSWD